MGDGRYYTFDQFFTIVILVFIIGFLTISFIQSWLKKTKKAHDSVLVAMFLGLLAIAVLHFFEELHMSEDFCAMLRGLQSLLLFAVNINFVFYLILLIKNKGKILKVNNKILAIPWLVLIAVLIVSYITNGSIFIESYSFGTAVYKSVFAVIHIAILLAILIIATVIYIQNKSHIKLEGLSLMLGFIGLLYVIPLIIYCLLIWFKVPALDWFEIWVVFLIAVTINIILNLRMSYGVSPFAFKRLLDSIEDYIFVTDTNDRIVFKNNKVIESNLFSQKAYIDTGDMSEFFACDITYGINLKDIRYIKPVYDRTCYLFRSSELTNNNKVLGKFITFIEATELINLLTKLQEQERRLKIRNNELIDYKKDVYYLKKEKEINSLLREIIAKQEKSMVAISTGIEKCRKNIDDNNFSGYLDEVISQIGNNLELVRKSVSAYSRHYGGKS